MRGFHLKSLSIVINATEGNCSTLSFKQELCMEVVAGGSRDLLVVTMEQFTSYGSSLFGRLLVCNKYPLCIVKYTVIKYMKNTDFAKLSNVLI